MNWRPIDMAPKDGTVIELMNEHNGLCDIGCWCDYTKRGWSITGIDGEWSRGAGNGDMTHWRPMSSNNEEFAAYLESLPEAKNALRNILLLAMREAHKAKDPEIPWSHVIRFCAEGGERPSPLRATPSAPASDTAPPPSK